MTDLSKASLRVCPFCGEAMQLRAALWPSGGDTDSVIHAAPTHCPMTDFNNRTFDLSVVDEWNRRADPEGLIAALREALEFQNEDSECLVTDDDTYAAACPDRRCRVRGCMVLRVNRWRAALAKAEGRE